MIYSSIDKIRKVYFRVFKGDFKYKSYHTKILNVEESNNLISETIKAEKPAFIAKLGESELEVLRNYLAIKRTGGKSGLFKFIDYAKFGDLPEWTGLNTITNDSGFFPKEENLLFEFSKIYIKALNELDLLASFSNMSGWYNNKGEDYTLRQVNTNINLIDARALHGFYLNNESWVKWLKNKKVLVIHPFNKSIEKQFKNRHKLFPFDFLPDFDLKTIKAVQTIAGTSSNFKSWFDALNFMKNEMENTEFDILLVGAGAYGLPLAHHAKELNKVGIHLGGVLQLFFGIKGKRWDRHHLISGWYNKYWQYPLKEEVPGNYKNVGNGSYAYWQ